MSVGVVYVRYMHSEWRVPHRQDKSEINRAKQNQTHTNGEIRDTLVFYFKCTAK